MMGTFWSILGMMSLKSRGATVIWRGSLNWFWEGVMPSSGSLLGVGISSEMKTGRI